MNENIGSEKIDFLVLNVIKRKWRIKKMRHDQQFKIVETIRKQLTSKHVNNNHNCEYRHHRSISVTLIIIIHFQYVLVMKFYHLYENEYNSKIYKNLPHSSDFNK